MTKYLRFLCKFEIKTQDRTLRKNNNPGLLRRNRFPGTSERFPAVYAMTQIRIYLPFPDDLYLLGDIELS